MSPGSLAAFLATLVYDNFGKTEADLLAAGYTKIPGPDGYDLFVDSDGKVQGIIGLDEYDAYAIAGQAAIRGLINAGLPLPGVLGEVVFDAIRQIITAKVWPAGAGAINPAEFTETNTDSFNGDTQPHSIADPLPEGAAVWRAAATANGDILNGTDSTLTIGGNDIISSGEGNDAIFGYGGEDILDGQLGNDIVWGNEGDDIIFGGQGDDTLRGGKHDDVLTGGQGNDFIDGGDVTVAPGENGLDDGFDTAKYNGGPAGLTISISAIDAENRIINVLNDGYGTTDVLHSIERIQGSDLTGDKIDFSNLDGPIYYGRDPDSGQFSLYGGYDFSLSQVHTVLGINQREIIKEGKGFVDQQVEFHNFEELIGTGFSDVISVTSANGGNPDDDPMAALMAAANSSGDSGASLPTDPVVYKVDGGGGNDFFFADDVSAELRGGDGEDTFYTSGAQTHIYGGAENDHFYLGSNSLVEDATDQETIDFGSFSLTGGVSFSWQESGYSYWQPFSAILMGFPTLASKFTEFWSLFALDVKFMSWMRYGMTTDGYLIAEMGQGKGGRIGVADYEMNLDTGLGTGLITVFSVDYREADGSSRGFKGFIDLALQQGFGVRAGNFDPLVIDLDKDGLDLTRQNQRDVYFDLDADGFGERTGWVREDDGLLAIDLNGDGQINDIGELFGDAETSGLDALAVYDSNGDGVIDALDTQFSDLLIWQDLNQNGVVDAGELNDLAMHGIVAISLTGRDPEVTLSGGNEIREVADVTFADGSTSIAGDVWFDANQVDSKYLGDVTISAAALALPSIRGFGNIKDLRTEMTLNATLLTQVDDFTQLAGTLNWQTYRTDVESILYEWAGVTAEAAAALGSEGFDLRKLAYLETAADMELAPRDIVTGDVLDTNVGELQSVWEEAVATQTARLLFQAQYAGYLSGISYDLDKDIFEADSTNALADTFLSFFAALPVDAAQALTAWQGDFAPALAAAISIMDRSDGIDMRTDFVIGQLVRAHDSADTLSLAELVGGLGYDNIYLDGAFTRTEDGGVHVYVGTSADETYTGGNGQDAYIFEQGSIGHDTIIDAEPGATPWGDRLRLVDLNPEDVTMARNGVDLVVTVTATGETITVQNQYTTPDFAQSGRQVSANWGIEDIQFADGSIFEAVEIGEAVGRGVDGQDDILDGTAFDDQLNGGTGNDTLRGGDGGDMYVFGLGSGHDIIEDEMLNPYNDRQDLLVLTDGLSLDDMQFTRISDSDDLTITFTTPGAENDSLTLVGQFAYSTYGYDNEYALDQRIEAFASNQDAPIDWGTLQQWVIEDYTTSGDDVTYGFGTADLFGASAGDDWLSGGDSGDIYQFGFGSGHDTIEDNQLYQEILLNILPGSQTLGSDDHLVFGAGITAADVTFSVVDGTRDLLISIDDDPTVAGASDTIRIADQFNGLRVDLFGLFGIAWFDRVEQFVFSDGTVLTWEDVLDVVTTGDENDNSLIGDHSADTLVGNGGNDNLSGGDDGDTYVYNLGDGNDVIEDNQYDVITTAADKLQFGSGITSSDVSFSFGPTDNDVLVTLTDGSTITLVNQLLGYNSYIFDVIWSDRIETLEFTDAQGQVVDSIGWDAIMTTLVTQQQTAGDDTIYGIDSEFEVWSDVIDAGGGNDTIFGLGGEDTITGGAGNDTSDGGWGNDTYIFNPGDGIDTIQDNGSGLDLADKLVIGYNVADVSVTRPAGTNDIVLTFAGSTDQITVFNALSGKKFNSIETYEFLDANWTPVSIAQSLVDGQITEGADIITGSGVINGLGGNDLIWGEDLADTLSGGLGDDFLDGGAGTDTYIYNAGDGHDTIQDIGNGIDTDDLLQITGYTRAQTTIELIDGLNQIDLVFTGTGDRISLIDPLASGSSFRGINLIEFVDEGVTWNTADLSALAVAAQATSGDDQIIGSSVADIIDGGAGDDDIAAGDGQDDLSGGAGNDQLDGGTNNDTYRFGQGDGQDTITETGNGLDSADKLIISDYLSNQTIVQRVAGTENILLTFAGSTDSITLVRGLTGNYLNQIESYEFEADGTIWTPSDLAAEILLREVTAGDDDVQGFDTADIITAGAGNDSIHGLGGADLLSGDVGDDFIDGGEGTDTYLYNLGDGHDTIHDQGNGLDTDDILKISGYTSAQTTVEIVNGMNQIDLVFNGTGDRISLIDPLASAPSFRGINLIEFVDEGVTWDVSDIGAAVMAAQSTSGDDVIVGSAVNDIISGGLGNDTIDGSEGDDTYIFNLGDGHDTIADNGNGLDGDDRLIINGYLMEDVIATGIGGNDVELTFAGTSDKITLVNALANGVFQTIDYYEFVDGGTTTVWTKQDLADAVAGNVPPGGTVVTHPGTAAAETINGTSGDDVINGLAGDDTLAGKAGDDTYLYASGDGNDIIDDSGYATGDVLKLTNLNAADIELSKSGNHLLITTLAAGQVITDNYHFLSATSLNRGIDTIEFADGSSWDYATINANAWIRGTSGNETLTGSNLFDETLQGYAGDDTMQGRNGADTYIYASGDGNDIINDDVYVAGDVLKLTDLNAADIELSKSGFNMLITDLTTGQVITDNYHFLSATSLNRGIDTIQFADGSSWDYATINANAWIRGTSGNDTLNGSNLFDETLLGYAGDDTLQGGNGADTYIYASGDGNDTIKDDVYVAGDVLKLTDLNAVDIALSKSGFHMLLTDVTTSQVITDHFHFLSTTSLNRGIDTIQFADGSSWDYDTINAVARIETTALADTASGTTGDDVIIGLGGNDTLTGLAGADTFVFAAGDGTDTISDFSVADTDRIDVSAYGLASNADFTGFSFDGTDTVVDFNGTDQVTVAGVNLTTQPNPDDVFIFV
ncbi:MAG: calcium-binding protein [Anderseniella sp.]